MIHTIFSAGRKSLRHPVYVTVIVRDWGSRKGKREYLNYLTREERDQARHWRVHGMKPGELYFINVYPKP